jgi:hypothetical protein|tara:strand:- start:116 stop:511 length:396 start_codon:yes stop_codon:yes gene_type:complete
MKDDMFTNWANMNLKPGAEDLDNVALIWNKQYEALRKFDQDEYKHFADKTPAQQMSMYQDILFDITERVAQVESGIKEIMQRCNDVKHEDDLEVEYLNLTCGFAVMSKLQTRRIDIKKRIDFLSKMARRIN